MKYSKEMLEPLVQESRSFAELARRLGLKLGGNSQAYLKQVVKKFGIDTGHFPGKTAHLKPGVNKRPWQELLVLGQEDGPKLSSPRLRRALRESGRPYRCEAEGCTITDMWLGKPITLQVHHVNGRTWDNRPDNIQFHCPNCHTQTGNWGFKTREESDA